MPLLGGVGEASDKCLGKEERPVLVLGRGARDQDVAQLGDVSSCYGDLYLAFRDDLEKQAL